MERIVPPDPDLRFGRQREDHREGARRRLPRQRPARCQRRTPQAIFHQGRPRLSNQQIGARPVRLRSARSRSRSAVLEAGSRELSQRPHLFRTEAPAESPFDISLCAEPARFPRPRPHGEHLRVRPTVLCNRQDHRIFARTGHPSALRFSPRAELPVRIVPSDEPRPADYAAARCRRGETPRSLAPGPLRAAGRSHQREDGDSAVSRADRRLSSAGARGASEQRHQDGARRTARRAAGRDRASEEGDGSGEGGRRGGRCRRGRDALQRGGDPLHGTPRCQRAALRRAVRRRRFAPGKGCQDCQGPDVRQARRSRGSSGPSTASEAGARALGDQGVSCSR